MKISDWIRIAKISDLFNTSSQYPSVKDQVSCDVPEPYLPSQSVLRITIPWN